MIVELEIFKRKGAKGAKPTAQTNNQEGRKPFTFHFFCTIIKNQCKNKTCRKVRN